MLYKMIFYYRENGDMQKWECSGVDENDCMDFFKQEHPLAYVMRIIDVGYNDDENETYNCLREVKHWEQEVKALERQLANARCMLADAHRKLDATQMY